MRSSGAENYGKYYWCVKTGISESGEIYVFADEVVVGEDGSLIFNHRFEKDGKPMFHVNLAIASGEWTVFYAASCIDGHAAAVEHWKGEIDNG